MIQFNNTKLLWKIRDPFRSGKPDFFSDHIRSCIKKLIRSAPIIGAVHIGHPQFKKS